MNSKKGISLIALIVTIIVMIMLSAYMINVSMTGFESTSEAKIVNEKNEITQAIIKRFSSNALNANAYPLLGSVVLEADLSEISGINLDNIDYIRKINSSDVQQLGVRNATGNMYIVDYLAGEVYGPVQ